jgi:hypothetical protein
MTRRVTLCASVLAIAGLGAIVQPAAAVPPQPGIHAAAFDPLTEARARKLALSLARRVARERDVVAWHLSPAVKVRRTRIVFVYDDRNRDDVFCTAKVIVEQTARERSVTIGSGRCAAVPAEALSIEKRTNALIRAVRGKVGELRRSLRAYDAQIRRCEGLVVPRGHHEDAEALFDAAGAVAFVAPIAAQLDGFVTALQNIQPEDPDLVRGVVAWRRLLTIVDALPRPVTDPCGALQQWAANSYAPEAAPVDFAELRELLASGRRQERRIFLTSLRLARLGVFPNAALGFTPDGLAELVGVSS